MSDSVWRNGDFVKLWTGHAITQLGSEITLLALPLLAASLLGATPLQMGLLMAAEQLPPLLLGVFAGALVDRYAPKRFLVSADVARALLLGLIAALWAAGALTFHALCAIAFLIGAFRTVFDVSYSPLLASVLDRRQFIDGNSQLGVARSAAEIAGPPAAGALIQAMTAPAAMLVDAFSFLVSAASILLIRGRPAAPRTRAERGIFREIAEGARATRGHSVQLALLLAAAIWNLFYSIIMAVFVLFAVRSLRITPVQIGLAFLPAGVGFLAGASITKRLSRRMGIGPVALLGIGVTAGWGGMVALASGGPATATAVLMAGGLVFGFGQALFNISSASIRQMITPVDLLGRVSAISAVVYRSTLPLGALLGGIMGERLGMRATVAVGALGLLGSAALLAFSPVRDFRGDQTT